MRIDLERVDILNILASLNATPVRGKENVIALLRLIQKMEAVLAAADAASNADAPPPPPPVSTPTG